MQEGVSIQIESASGSVNQLMMSWFQ